ncbi:hypothetical protein Syun_026099 [Stephania yunnanensis]|uniref:Uncharacterized protein n=1 Tax=Stephania yunnanensis TaxID=152371 RepID=A0AAP0F1S1_9MAGN
MEHFLSLLSSAPHSVKHKNDEPRHTADIRMLVTVDREIKMFVGIPIYVARVALAYIDWRRQMVHSLLGGRGGAQLVTEEPSLSRRSPTLQSKMGVWPWASMALGGYCDESGEGGDWQLPLIWGASTSLLAEENQFLTDMEGEIEEVNNDIEENLVHDSSFGEHDQHCHTPDVRRVQFESCNCCDLIQSSFVKATY